MLSSLNLVPPHNLALNQPCWCQTITRTTDFTAHYDDVIMGAMASQITSLTTVYSTVYSGTDQSKYQSCASLAFVWGLHRWPVNSPHKWPVTRKMFPFDDVIMICAPTSLSQSMLRQFKSDNLHCKTLYCYYLTIRVFLTARVSEKIMIRFT